MQINHDVPLNKKNALEKDKLDRAEFSRSVVKVLSKVNKDCGLVISIEGKWGSGKTSTLAMVEELLENDERKPIVVHFNPWLVGDRDALLGQFLSSIANAAKQTDSTKVGLRVAKTIEAYSGAFDIIKLIPGAEPWASIVKAAFTTVGGATGAVAKYKTPDITEKKDKVQEALVELKQPIIVFIDDMDRLFPNEVFEMIRIIKAVGELPNIGYVLAWDAAYIEDALKKGEVAYSTSYLDKIVQVRLNLPVLSQSARVRLFNTAYDALPAEAKNSNLQVDENLLPYLYHSSLNKLLDQPRDITKLFNLVQIMEPNLRGNVVLADIIGLAAISHFASPVYDLLKAEPESFTQPRTSVKNILKGEQDAITRTLLKKHDVAISACNKPDATKNLLDYLFPERINANQAKTPNSRSVIKGRLASIGRLQIALQWGASNADVDLNKVCKFILNADERSEIISTLTTENCLDFLSSLEGLSLLASDFSESEKNQLFIEIAQLLDREPYLSFVKTNHFTSENTALRFMQTISSMVTKLFFESLDLIPNFIVENQDTLSFSSYLICSDWLKNEIPRLDVIRVKSEDREILYNKFAENVIQKIKQKSLWDLAFPGGILRSATQANEDLTKIIFEEIQKVDPTLDNFATSFFKLNATTKTGSMEVVEYFGYWKKEDGVDISKYCSPEWLKDHANQRLSDPNLSAHVLGAWNAVATGWRYYSDGIKVD